MTSRKTLAFYTLDASTLGEPGRRLLREYSGIAEDDINKHVEAIRAQAFAVCPYPCIGMFQFLDLHLMTTAVYPEVLDRLKAGGETFLDLGCCLGQELRQLALDGAPTVTTFGSDLYRGFFDVGYDLFCDRDRLQTTFVAADVFDDNSPLAKLAGTMDMIYTGAFFHLWNREEQERAVSRVISLLRPRPGSLVIGRQTGSDEAGDFSRAGDTSGRTHFRHNAQSWKELWDRVGEKTGTRWSVEADLSDPEYTMAATAGNQSTELDRKIASKGLRFVIRRL